MLGSSRSLAVSAVLVAALLGPSASIGANDEGPVRVAAAISLRDALTRIAADFEVDTGAQVELTFGSSGQLLSQIRNGAPIDVFISAAVEQVDALEREKLVLAESRRVVAGNRLVLIVPKSADAKIAKLSDLAAATVKRVAIGDPATVPAGQYAQQVLDRLDLTAKLKDRMVYGANVRQVLSYVAAGEVSAGIVYSTDARKAQDEVVVVETVDANLHDPIVYPAIALKATKQPQLSDRFIRFMSEEKARAELARLGFAPPPEARPMSKPTASQSASAAGSAP